MILVQSLIHMKSNIFRYENVYFGYFRKMTLSEYLEINGVGNRINKNHNSLPVHCRS